MFLVLLFTIIPAIEFYLLFSIGSQIGAINTFSIIIFTGVVGAALAKSQGRSILINLQKEISQGKVPGNQLIQGFIVFGGGLLLLTPGFLTDIIGLAMVTPGTRQIIIIFISKLISKGIASGNINFMNLSSKRNNFHSQADSFEENSNSNSNSKNNNNNNNNDDIEDVNFKEL